jgi:thiol-disulfide isomerase/thioredoxin
LRDSDIGSSRPAAFLLLLLIALILPRPLWAGNSPESISVIDSVLHDTTTLRNKVVYLDFWASWCPPCKSSFPWMCRLVDRYQGKGLEVVAVNVDRKPSAAHAFLEHLKSPLQEATDSPASWDRLFKSVVFDSTGSVAKRFELEALPTSYIYGRDGRLRSQHQGFDESDTLSLDSLLTALLAEKGAK